MKWYVNNHSQSEYANILLCLPAWCTEMPLSLVVMETAENLLKVSYVTQKTEHSLMFPLCSV